MKIKYSLLSLIGISIFFNSCQKNAALENLDETNKIILSTETFNFIGESHNEGLDYVFSNTFAINPKTNFEDVNKATIDYLYKINPSTKLTSEDKNKFFTNSHKDLIKDAVFSNSIIIDSFKLLQVVTPNQFAFLKQIDHFVTNNSLEFDERISGLKKLEIEAIKNLNDNEIVYILCVSNLARHSLSYWNSGKGSLWSQKIAQNNDLRGASTLRAIDWHDIAVADVAAFIVGFPLGVNVGMVVGGVTAGIASAGITAGLGAVLGGVAGGTANQDSL